MVDTAQFPLPTDADIANGPTMLHTLIFLPGTTPAQFGTVAQPTLLMASDHSAAELLKGVEDLGDVIPNAVVRVLPGQRHGIPENTVVPTIQGFLAATALPTAVIKGSR